MECSKCHLRKDISDFSLKNVKDNIYYMYCYKCREQVVKAQHKYKEKMKEEYEIKKLTHVIDCECGMSFVAFRDFHMRRHVNSKYHKMYIQNKNI